MPDVNAVLVKLSISVFSNSRQDPQISDEVRARKGLGIGAGKWVKYILPDECLKGIREAAGNGRRRHYDMTLPWEEGLRLVSAKAHVAYQDNMQIHSRQFWAAVDAFGEQYPNWVTQAKIMHGKTFDPSLYPEWERMRALFGYGVEYQPIPKAEHFVKTSGIAQEAIEQMQNELETRSQQKINEAVRDTFNRVMTPVQALAEKLSDKKAIFRDSLISNITEVLDLIPILNLTNDSMLNSIAEEIRTKFKSLDADTLRSNSSIRLNTAAEAKKLAERFGTIGKRRFA